jgi:adiponectin receptor
MSIPDYLKDNPFVTMGYRPEMTPRKALWTLTHWHNETLNIYSHALGVPLFIYFSYSFATIERVYEVKYPMYIFQACTIYLFLVSAAFHTFMCVSRRYFDMFRLLDFTGIVAVMFSMFVPWSSYAFKCSDYEYLVVVYIAIAFTISTMSMFVVVMPTFQKYHVMRLVVYASQGLFGVVPIVHAALLNVDTTAIQLVCIQLILHCIGAIVYGTKIPERYLQGRCVYVTSHVIFHVFIVAGFVAFNQAIVILYNKSNVLQCN